MLGASPACKHPRAPSSVWFVRCGDLGCPVTQPRWHTERVSRESALPNGAPVCAQGIPDAAAAGENGVEPWGVSTTAVFCTDRSLFCILLHSPHGCSRDIPAGRAQRAASAQRAGHRDPTSQRAATRTWFRQQAPCRVRYLSGSDVHRVDGTLCVLRVWALHMPERF